MVCGVSSLGIDHTSLLGDTVEKIAWQKGGIFKVIRQAGGRGVPRGPGPQGQRSGAGTGLCVLTRDRSWPLAGSGFLSHFHSVERLSPSLASVSPLNMRDQRLSGRSDPNLWGPGRVEVPQPPVSLLAHAAWRPCLHRAPARRSPGCAEGSSPADLSESDWTGRRVGCVWAGGRGAFSWGPRRAVCVAAGFWEQGWWALMDGGREGLLLKVAVATLLPTSLQCPLYLCPPLEALEEGGPPLTLGLEGEHQRSNAALALQLACCWLQWRDHQGEWPGEWAGRWAVPGSLPQRVLSVWASPTHRRREAEGVPAERGLAAAPGTRVPAHIPHAAR